MNLSSLRFAPGSRKKSKRRGRGQGSGSGGTAARGHKGYHSRSGSKRRAHFEGGQMPLHRRLPKRGFKNILRQPVQIVNLRQLNSVEENEIDLDLLKNKRLIDKLSVPVKLLGDGEISRKIKITVNAVSSSAREKVEAAGGEVVII
jgi:large subunit ribosomal protein L15